MTGTLLKKILDTGDAKWGKGAYLQRYKTMQPAPEGKGWLVNGLPLEEEKTYRIAMNDFLLTGYDLDFLTKDNPGILRIDRFSPGDPSDLRRDVRVAVAHYLQNIK